MCYCGRDSCLPKVRMPLLTSRPPKQSKNSCFPVFLAEEDNPVPSAEMGTEIIEQDLQENP